MLVLRTSNFQGQLLDRFRDINNLCIVFIVHHLIRYLKKLLDSDWMRAV